MTDRIALEETLAAGGNVMEPLGRAERWRLEQAWRHVYALATRARTGQWRIPDYEWHVFSYGDARSKSGARALELYQHERPASFLVWPEAPTVPMYRCSGGTVPVFSTSAADVLVFPPDLSWTMAFTHELGLGLGPYFSRREWLGEPSAV